MLLNLLLRAWKQVIPNHRKHFFQFFKLFFSDWSPYDQCLSYSPVTSFWRPLAGTHPYLGAENTLCQAEEFKVEVTCRTEQVDEILQAVKAAHPYEEPVINVIPLYRTSF